MGRGSGHSTGAVGASLPLEGDEAATSCAWDMVLRFRDPKVEAEFSATNVHALRALDFKTMALDVVGALVTAIGATYAADGSSWSPFVHSGEFAVIVLHRFAMIWLMLTHPRWYDDRRTMLVAASRLHAFSAHSRMIRQVGPPLSLAPLSVVFHLLGTSSIATLALGVVAMPLYFREQLAVQSLNTLAGMFWASTAYCREWNSSAGAMGGDCPVWGQPIGDWIGSLIRRSSFLGLSWDPLGLGGMRLHLMSAVTAPSNHSCWVVLAFFHFAFGLVAPTAALYCVERQVRFNFLMSQGGSCSGGSGVVAGGVSPTRRRRRRRSFFLQTVYFAIWMSVIAMVMGWTVLKTVEELGCLKRLSVWGATPPTP